MPNFAEEKEIIKLLDSLDEESKAIKRDFSRRVEENLKLVRGDGQWKNTSRDPYFLLNILGKAVEDKVGKLSEGRPKLRVLAGQEGLESSADVLQKAISSFWDTHEIEYQNEYVGFYGAIMGASTVLTVFDPHYHFGTGDIDFIVRDPRTVRIDPSIVRPLELANPDRAAYCAIDDVMSLSRIRSYWPGRGGLVEPDDRVSTFEDFVQPRTAKSLIQSAAAFLRGKAGSANRKEGPIRRGIVTEYYVEDRRANINEDGLIPLLQGVTKYATDGGIPFPGGRRIIRAGDVILEDSFNPYWDGMMPLDMLSWKIDLETPWGPDEVQTNKRSQESINRTGDAYVKSLLINTVVRVVLDQNALSPEERNKLSNFVGQIVEKRPGRDVKFDVPLPLPPDTLVFIEKIKGWMQENIGVAENPAQKRIPSIITGPALEGLQIMVETSIRTAARRMESFYRRIGQKLISRVFQYYPSNKLMPMVGSNGDWETFEFRRLQLVAKDKSGTPRTEEEIRKAYADYFFAIEPGSSLPITRVQRALAKAMMADRGWLHPKEVLEEYAIQNPEEKLEEAAKYFMEHPPPSKDGRKGDDVSKMMQSVGG